jgi:integrase
MSKKLTPVAIRNLKPEAERYEVPDGGCVGLYCVVQPSGVKGFALRYRRDGKPAKLTLGRWFDGPEKDAPDAVLGNPLTLAAARKIAADAKHKVEEGRDPNGGAGRGPNTLKVVAENYLALEGAKLRTADQRISIFRRLIYPVLGDTRIDRIRRSDISALLDRIERDSGPRMADVALAALSKLFRWYAVRVDSFNSPIVPGMGRAAPAHERARSRILTDDELRRVWRATEQDAALGGLVRFLLLTAARRSEAAEMTWNEIEGSDWVLPAWRNKVKQDLVRPLSTAALEVIEQQPRVEGFPHVFARTGTRLFYLDHYKRTLDQRADVTDWTLHDLRRTARSLMSRAGVNADHAERCLGHVIGGVRGTYDRHAYHAEKKHAFEALAALVERIVNPPTEKNVLPLRRTS